MITIILMMTIGMFFLAISFSIILYQSLDLDDSNKISLYIAISFLIAGMIFIAISIEQDYTSNAYLIENNVSIDTKSFKIYEINYKD